MSPIARGLRLVAIGGGTGLESLLRGLKVYLDRNRIKKGLPYLESLTAIVTVADDGGKSGKLIDEFGILPPGDIRGSLASLSDEEDLISKLFRLRLTGGGELGGHSFGNLFLTALIQMNNGNFLKAIKDASKVLRVEGVILPATLDNVILCAQLEDGKIIMGESEITNANHAPIKKVFFSERENKGNNSKPEAYMARPLREATNAILSSDMIVIGPGGLYTSVIPNLLVKGISKAVANSKARKIYIGNIMTQKGRTSGYSLSDHIRKIMEVGGFRLDYVLVNNRKISDDIMKKYEEEGSTQLFFDPNKSDVSSVVKFSNGDHITLVEGTIIIEAPLAKEVVEESIKKIGDVEEVESKVVIRHDPDKLAVALMDIFESI
ncbi:MAG: gluconeogenesis factor YvcK family protein [bacterium]